MLTACVMNDRDSNDLSNEATVYGVPRRYDLATLLAVSVSFALLFSVLRPLGASPFFIAVVVTFIALVGLAQAIMLGGRAPRRASIAVGMLYGPTLVGIEAYLFGYRVNFSGLFLATLFYAPVGYLLGVVIGGVFLVSDYLRRFIRLGRNNHGS
jgi:uncharacterized protein YhhL (DUF1145 family)